MPWWIPAIITAILWGVSYTAIEPVVKNIDKSTYIFIAASVSFLVYGFISLYYNHFPKDIQVLSENPQCALYCTLAIVSGVVANYIALKAIESSGASLAAALEISYPFWCMLFAWILWNETLSYQALLGTALTFLGIYLIAGSK